MTLVDRITLTVEVLEAKELWAGHRPLGKFGQKHSARPYALVFWGDRQIGKTSVQKRTLDPQWNDESFTFAIDNYHQANRFLNQWSKMPLTLHILDRHTATADAPMGSVEYFIDPKKPPEKEWVPVQPGRPGSQYYCNTVTGQVCLRVTLTAKKVIQLVPGNIHSLDYSSVHVGFSWDTTEKNDFLEVSCVAISTQGQALWDQTVYSVQTHNPDSSIVYSSPALPNNDSDAPQKYVKIKGKMTINPDYKRWKEMHNGKGDDATIQLKLNLIPDQVLALYLVMSVPNGSLAQSIKIRFYHPQGQLEKSLCGLMVSDLNSHNSLVMAKLERDQQQGWQIRPLLAGLPARDFGLLIPQLQSYTRDILPNIPITTDSFGESRVAIMRQNDTIRVRDFCRNRKIPAAVSFGLAWDNIAINNGNNSKIDYLDASAICLDSDLQEVDLVFCKQLQSKDGSIDFASYNRSGDDETILNISFETVPSDIQYIGIVLHSGQGLDAQASCRLYDTETEIARYSSQLRGEEKAFVLGCLYRIGPNDNDWLLHTVSEPVDAAQDNVVKESQTFLRRHPPPTRPTIVVPEKEEMDLHMPTYVAHNEEEEIVEVPISDIID